MLRASSSRVVRTLADHPRRAEIMSAFSRLPFLDEAELTALAEAWRNSTTVAAARRRALSPDEPFVLDTLAAFDLVGTLFADDVLGSGPHLTLPPEVTRNALKAIRDGLAALYARPSLTRWEANALAGPWRKTIQRTPARGHWPNHLTRAVDAAVGGAGSLTARCHDPLAERRFDTVVAAGLASSGPEVTAALDASWEAAVFSGRQRLWHLLRHAATESLAQGCHRCHRAADHEDRRVGVAAADAACGLLVRDLLGDEHLATLTGPVRVLLDQVTAADGVAEA